MKASEATLDWEQPTGENGWINLEAVIFIAWE
jgi:hypothetical protein